MQFLIHFAEFIPSEPIYIVDIDPQFIIPIVYFAPLLVGYILRRYAPNLLVGIITGLVFTACFTVFTFVLYADYEIWKFVMPIIAILGGLSGLSGWFRVLLKKIKNIGDDDSYIR